MKRRNETNLANSIPLKMLFWNIFNLHEYSSTRITSYPHQNESFSFILSFSSRSVFVGCKMCRYGCYGIVATHPLSLIWHTSYYFHLFINKYARFCGSLFLNLTLQKLYLYLLRVWDFSFCPSPRHMEKWEGNHYVSPI